MHADKGNLREERLKIRAFVEKEIVPIAGDIDREQAIPASLIKKLSSEGYLGYTIAAEYKGQAKDLPALGILSEEAGRACTSVRSLITVQEMVSRAIARWGTADQKEKWLPLMATGRSIGAFALTEPMHGSDAAGIRTSFRESDGSMIINGQKKWITFGQIADLFLLFGKIKDQATAIVVEKQVPGLSIAPIKDMLGVRGTMLAEITLDDCRVPAGNILGMPGMGMNPIAFQALQTGRFSIATGCVGMARTCFATAVRYSDSREQFGKPLKDHQLIQGMLADMLVRIRAAESLCKNASKLISSEDPDSFKEVLIAKYYASKAASEISKDAVQVLGAAGCSADHPVERFFRDSKIMEIIEGSDQLIQVMLSKYGLHEVNRF